MLQAMFGKYTFNGRIRKRVFFGSYIPANVNFRMPVVIKVNKLIMGKSATPYV